MISQTGSSTIRSAYPSKTNEIKEQKHAQTLSLKGDSNKVDKLRESIDSGEYKVDIQALSEKMADSLL